MDERPRRTADELVRLARIAYDAGDHAEAEALARRALMLSPASVDARQVAASAVIEQGRYGEAIPWLEELLEEDPRDVVTLADLGLCLFELCEFEDAEAVLARALEIDPSDPQASYWMGLCIERRGETELAEEYFLRAHSVDPEAYPRPVRWSAEEFDDAVEEAAADLPPAMREALDRLELVVRDLPDEEDLLAFDPPLDPCLYGLFPGIPLPDREDDADPEPDVLYLYKRNLERMCPGFDVLVRELRLTLLYEIGHYLGLDGVALAEEEERGRT